MNYEIYVESPHNSTNIGEKWPTNKEVDRIDTAVVNPQMGEIMTLYGGIVFSFVDENGIKVGELSAAREDHRGFLGPNVMVGYNPWGWGGDTAELRGLNFSGLPLSVMERELARSIPRLQIVDEMGEVLHRDVEYLPYSPGVGEFQLNAILEDEETTFTDILDNILDPENELFPGASFGTAEDIMDFNVKRNFTEEEKTRLLEIILRKQDEINPLYLDRRNGKPKKNVGLLGDKNSLDPDDYDMFEIVINAFPDVDYDRIKNWLNGRNSRFDLMDEDDFMAKWSSIAGDYIRFFDFDSYYLEWLWDADYGRNKEAAKFTEEFRKELYESGETWEDGSPMVQYDPSRNNNQYSSDSPYYFTNTNYDKSSELAYILETDVAKKFGLKENYQNVASAIIRFQNTPVDFGARNIKNTITGEVDRFNLSDQLRTMQPGMERFAENQGGFSPKPKNQNQYFRNIGGLRYQGSRPLKNPKLVAEMLRSRGYNARIIPTANGRRVYYAKRQQIPQCVVDAAKSSGVEEKHLFESFRRGYGAAITNPSSVRNKSTGQKRPGGWPASQRFSPTAWGCARAKKLGRLKENARYDQDLIRKWRKGA